MPDRPIFYVDRCVGKRVVQALRDAGARVEAHDDHFPPNEPDESWIPTVAGREWVILTKDKNIRRRAGEREAVVTNLARIITLTSGNVRGATMADVFVRHLEEMEYLACTHPAPFVAVLGPGGMQVVMPRSAQSGPGKGKAGAAEGGEIPPEGPSPA